MVQAKDRRLPRNIRGTLIRVIAMKKAFDKELIRVIVLKKAFDREFFFFREISEIEISCERPSAVSASEGSPREESKEKREIEPYGQHPLRQVHGGIPAQSDGRVPSVKRPPYSYKLGVCLAG